MFVPHCHNDQRPTTLAQPATRQPSGWPLKSRQSYYRSAGARRPLRERFAPPVFYAHLPLSLGKEMSCPGREPDTLAGRRDRGAFAVWALPGEGAEAQLAGNVIPPSSIISPTDSVCWPLGVLVAIVPRSLEPLPSQASLGTPFDTGFATAQRHANWPRGAVGASGAYAADLRVRPGPR